MNDQVEAVEAIPPELTLDDMYEDPDGDTEVTAEEPVKEPEAETQEVEAEETAEEPADDSPSESDQKVPLAALIAEREKRQEEAESRKALQAKLDELTEQEEKRPSVFENEEEAFASLEGSFQKQSMADRFALSRDFMGMLKDDYFELEKEFLDFAKEDSSLHAELSNHPNPARFAYETALKRRELKEMENLDEFRDKERAKIRDELKAELKAEMEAAREKEDEKQSAATPSLASARNTAGGNDEIFTDDMDVYDILEG